MDDKTEVDPNKKNEDGNQSDDNGQSSSDSDTNSVTLPKDEHEKLVRERDDYKARTLKLSAKKDLNDQDNDDDSAEENKASVDIEAMIDKKLNDHSSSTKKVLETRAQEEFLREHPELVESGSLHDELLSHLNLRGDELTVADYKKRLRSAYLVMKDEHGELDDYLSKEKESAARQARINAEVETGRSAGGNGDSRDGGSNSEKLTPKGEEMARGMKVDPAKAAKIKYGEDNIIDVLAPK